MKRDRPKSVSLTKGEGKEDRRDEGEAQGKGRHVRRMSARANEGERARRIVSTDSCGRTLELDVAVHESDLVHPPDGRAQLAKHSAREAFGHLRMPVGEKVEELAAGAIVEHEGRVDRCRERARQRDERRVLDVL